MKDSWQEALDWLKKNAPLWVGYAVFDHSIELQKKMGRQRSELDSQTQTIRDLRGDKQRKRDIAKR